MSSLEIRERFKSDSGSIYLLVRSRIREIEICPRGRFVGSRASQEIRSLEGSREIRSLERDSIYLFGSWDLLARSRNRKIEFCSRERFVSLEQVLSRVRDSFRSREIRSLESDSRDSFARERVERFVRSREIRYICSAREICWFALEIKR
jgi:hypothetical protein